MRLHSILFGVPRRGSMYQRLASVFEHSCAVNSPDTPLTLHRITEDDPELTEIAHRAGREAKYLDNARKTKHHCRIVQEAEDGELIGLLDCDMMVLRDLSPIEDLLGPYDFCYTRRPPGAKYPLNTGAVFIRVSDDIRHFYALWLDAAIYLLKNKRLHEDELKKRFGGLNQSALGLLFDKPLEINTMSVACQEWNCEDSSLKYFDDNTRIVHFAGGGLKKRVLGVGHGGNPILKRIIGQWREYEAQCSAAVT